MPSWKIHIEVANKVLENIKEIININKNDFYIGNIMPDIYGGHIVKGMSKHIEYSDSHYSMEYTINLAKFILPDFEKFKNIHDECIIDPVILGYFTHLMTDYYFNKYTYTNKYIIDSSREISGIKTKKNEVLNCSRKTAIRIKQEDFASFSDSIELTLYNFTYNSKLFESLNKLKTFKSETDDIVKITNYLNTLTKDKVRRTKPLVMFLNEELEYMINECATYISEYIKRNILK